MYDSILKIATLAYEMDKLAANDRSRNIEKARALMKNVTPSAPAQHHNWPGANNAGQYAFIGKYDKAGLAERGDYAKSSPEYMRMKNQSDFGAAHRGSTPIAAPTTPTATLSTSPAAKESLGASLSAKARGLMNTIKANKVKSLGGAAAVGATALGANALYQHHKQASDEDHTIRNSALAGAGIGAGIGLVGTLAVRAAGNRIGRYIGEPGLGNELATGANRPACAAISNGLGGALLGAGYGVHKKTMQENSGDPAIRPSMGTWSRNGAVAGGLLGAGLGMIGGAAISKRLGVPVDATGNAINGGLGALVGINGGALLGGVSGYIHDRAFRDNGKKKQQR